MHTEGNDNSIVALASELADSHDARWSVRAQAASNLADYANDEMVRLGKTGILLRGSGVTVTENLLEIATWTSDLVLSWLRMPGSGKPWLSAYELARGRVQNEDLPSAERLSWALVALVSLQRCSEVDEESGKQSVLNEISLRCYILSEFGHQARSELLDSGLLWDLVGNELQEDRRVVQKSAARWRELDIREIGLLRRYKNVVGLLPHLPPGLLATAPPSLGLPAWLEVLRSLP